MSNYDVIPQPTVANKSSYNVVPTPFDSTFLGILKNTITGIPKAAENLINPPKAPAMEFRVGQGLNPDQAKVANDVVRKPSDLPPEPLTFGESQNVINQKIAADIAAKQGKPINPNYVPSSEMTKEALQTGYINPVISSIGGSGEVKSLLKPGEIPQGFLDAMSKESNPVVIEKTLNDIGAHPADAKVLAPQIAEAKTAEQVKNILINHEPVANTPNRLTGNTSGPIDVPNTEIPITNESTPVPPTPEPSVMPGNQASLFDNSPKVSSSEIAPTTPISTNLPPEIKAPEFKITGNTEKQRVDSAVTNSERIRNELSIKGKEAYTSGKGSGFLNSGLSPADIKLAEQYQQGTTIPDLAKKAENPKKFTDFMNKAVDYYNFRYAADIAAGGNTGYVPNYLPQYWDLSKPSDLEKYNKLAVQKGLTPYKGFNAQPRVFNSYAAGEAQGFKRLNPNILEDLKTDYGKASDTISKQVLKKGLTEAAPEKVSFHGLGRTDKGKAFLNSNIPGLQGMSYAPEISDQLKGFESLTNKDFIKMAKDESGGGFKNTLKSLPKNAKEAGLSGTLGTLYDHANQPLKHIILNLSGFHSINITASHAGASLFNHPIKGAKGIILSVPSFFSEAVTKGVINSFKNKIIPGTNTSVFDAGLRSGVNMDRALPVENSYRHPMKSLANAMFDRELYTLKLNLVDQVFGDGKINPESPKGRALGKEINLIMGEMNGRLQNINPNTQKWLTRILLAPGFTESKYTVLGHALSQSGKENAGNFARSSVIGKSIIIGTLATLGTILATGKFPNLHQILLNYTTNPSSQTNIRNNKGQLKDIGFPKTYLDEPLSAIQDPGQYFRSRFAPALTNIYESLPPSVIGTGKNYYGAPIVDPKSKTPAIIQTLKNVGISNFPIGLQQLINYGQGSETGLEAGLGIAGLSTHLKPKPSIKNHISNY